MNHIDELIHINLWSTNIDRPQPWHMGTGKNLKKKWSNWIMIYESKNTKIKVINDASIQLYIEYTHFLLSLNTSKVGS